MPRISQHPSGRRLHVGPLRVHHFDFGLAAIAVGLWLVASDRRDLLDWVLHGRRS